MKTSQPDERGQIAFLDLLRGVAPLLVLWAHLGGWWLSAREVHSPLQQVWTDKVVAPLHLWQDGGYLGVLIFFLVSGFIISHVSLRETPTEFAIKRCFRILPLFWAVLALIGLLVYVSGKLGLPMILGPESEELDFFGSATFANWLVGDPSILSLSWTLHIEVMFYAVILILMPMSRRSALAGSWAALGVVLAVHMYMFKLPACQPFLWQWMYLPFLLVGRAYYLSWARLTTTSQAVFYGVTSLVVFLVMFDDIAIGRLFSNGVEAIISHAIALLSFGALCFARVRVVAPMKFCADISYSLYLLHAPLGSFLLDCLTQLGGLRFELALPITISTLLLVSWLSFRFVEQPIQRFGRRLIRRFQLGLAPPDERRDGESRTATA